MTVVGYQGPARCAVISIRSASRGLVLDDTYVSLLLLDFFFVSHVISRVGSLLRNLPS